MNMKNLGTTAAFVCLVSLMACSSASPTGGSRPQSEAGQPASGSSQRQLVMVARGEPPSLASRPLVPFSGALTPPTVIFNGTLDFTDARGKTYPVLATALPQLNTDTWRILPDGGMETKYTLKPGLTWQDGAPLTSDDFIFSWQVYSAPSIGAFNTQPIRQMEDVLGPDPQTVVIKWRQLYGEATDLGPDFPPLPRHLLHEPFTQLDPAAFAGHSFWTSDYVGLGPYRVTRWEPGAFLDATAFDGYALGKPKIERVEMLFISDTNTALANLLSGEVQYVGDFVFADTEAQTLEQRWASDHGGEVLYGPTEFRMTTAQLRPEVADPPAILDARVRKAIAHGIDTATMVQVLTGGKGLLTYTMTSPSEDYYAEVDRVIEKHAYDPQRSAQLLGEAGFTKGSDGFFVDRSGQSFTPTVYSSSGPKNEQENQVLVDSLRRSGINAASAIVPAAQVRDAQARALLPSLQLRGFGARRIELQISEEIPRNENRWQGENRGAWSNAEYDRLYQELTQTIDHNERIRKIAEMERVFSEEAPSIPHFYGAVVTAHTANLKGPVPRLVPEAEVGWYDTHLWEWR